MEGANKIVGLSPLIYRVIPTLNDPCIHLQIIKYSEHREEDGQLVCIFLFFFYVVEKLRLVKISK